MAAYRETYICNVGKIVNNDRLPMREEAFLAWQDAKMLTYDDDDLSPGTKQYMVYWANEAVAAGIVFG